MERDTAFELSPSALRFGEGVTREVGMELADLGVRRAMVLTDPGLTGLPPVATVLESLRAESVDAVLYDRVRVEPTENSFHEAIAFAQQGGFDAFVAVGGGSTMDTAKAADLYSTYPAEFLAYVNAPIGCGLPVPGPLKPLIAIPTTAGTGSETTGVAIFELPEQKVKTGIAHRRLKPLLGLVDPDNTRTLPSAVAASTGLDVLSHAAESLTAILYTDRPRPARPSQRPAYQGANPLSDVWALEALRLVSTHLFRAVADPGDAEARRHMLLAAAVAGIGFGHAGVHLPHAMAYPVAGLVHQFVPHGYSVDHPLVPHGMAVILNSPAAFRFTAPACPDRHLQAAAAMGADVSRARPEDAGAVLADRFIHFMQRLGLPNGLAAVGYTRSHIPALVQGTLAQQRLMRLSPRPVGEEELARVFGDALVYW